MLTDTEDTAKQADFGSSPGWWRAPGGLHEAFVTAVPLMISSLSWTVMNFIDRLFLLNYSADAVAAALPSGIMAFTVICFPLGVASYVSTFVAQYFGAGRHAKIGQVVWQAVWIGVATVPWSLAFIPLAPALFEQGDNGAAIVALEIDYFRSLSYSGAAIVLSGALSAHFNGLGRVRTVMIVDASAAGLNVVLDYFWIFGLMGFPRWGIAGAGWATTVALWAKTAVYLWLFLRRGERERFGTWTGRRFDLGVTRRLLRFGAVSGLQMMLEVAAFGLFTLLVGRLGSEALAATSLAFNVNNFAFMPVYGVGIAASTMVGRRLGEERPDLAARSTWSCLFWGLAYMGTICLFYVALPDLTLMPYGMSGADATNYENLHAVSVVLLRFLAAFGLLDALNIILSGTLKGAGDVRFVLVSSIAIAVACVFATWAGIAAGGGLIWCWSVLTAWVLGLAAAFFFRFRQGRWKSLRVIEPAMGE